MRAVREALEAARSAAIELQSVKQTEALMRSHIGVGGHSYEAHPKVGIFDPSRKIVGLLAWEESSADTSHLEAIIGEGRQIVDGAAEWCDPLGLEVLTRYYLHGEALTRISRNLGNRLGGVLPYDPGERDKVVRRALQATVDGLEGVGMARLRQGLPPD